MKNKQPAKVSYFFRDGYIDLVETFKDAWAENLDNAEDTHINASVDGYFTFFGALNFILTICIYTSGSLITLLLAALHALFLLFISLCIYIVSGILWTIDRIYIILNKIRNACPNPDCQASFIVPTYRCSCGRWHTRLVPGKYGIFKRRCECGEKLPTTFLNGRSKLEAYCPECKKPLSGDTACRQYAFPVVGGPSVGKTCFINMSINQMMNKVAPEYGWNLSFVSKKEKNDHASSMASLKKGIRLKKTELDSLTAYQLMLKLPKEKVGRRIYVYDISGEMFSNSGDVQRNNAYSYADGFVFIIDPLTIPRLAGELEDSIDMTSYGASAKDFEDVLDIMVINLQKIFDLKDEDKINKNIAVVINKVDIPTLEEKIGESAVRLYQTNNSETCKNRMEARNTVCRKFLEEYDAGNFVRKVEMKFKNVAYFTCSSLGHNNEGQPYYGKNVVDPILWLLALEDSSINIKQ